MRYINKQHVSHLTKRQCVMFGLFCCASVGQVPNKSRLANDAVECIERWLKDGIVTNEAFLIYSDLGGQPSECTGAIFHTLSTVISQDSDHYMVECCDAANSAILHYPSPDQLYDVFTGWLSKYSIEHVVKEITREII